MFDKLAKIAHRGILHASKHSPTIMAVAGVVGIVGGAVLLVKGAFKSAPLIEDLKTDLAMIDEVSEKRPDTYSKEDRVSDTTKIITRYAIGIGRELLPGIALLAVGTGSLLGGNHILSKRNAALAAAYKAVSESFEVYRKRVEAAIGEEKSREITVASREEIRRQDDPNDVEKAKEALGATSPYSRWFDEGSHVWSKDTSLNILTLKQCQELANRKLNAQGHLFLNEVYDMLGLKRSTAGAVVGWVVGNGDDFVDFGVFGRDDEAVRDFFNGWTKGVILDFNVDGVIHELI